MLDPLLVRKQDKTKEHDNSLHQEKTQLASSITKIKTQKVSPKVL